MRGWWLGCEREEERDVDVLEVESEGEGEEVGGGESDGSGVGSSQEALVNEEYLDVLACGGRDDEFREKVIGGGDCDCVRGDGESDCVTGESDDTSVMGGCEDDLVQVEGDADSIIWKTKEENSSTESMDEDGTCSLTCEHAKQINSYIVYTSF